MARKLSKHQQLVLACLTSADTPRGAYSLLDDLRSEGLRSPLQIYRALEKLIAHGLVHRIESLNAFVACAAPDCHDTELAAFAICSDCGEVAEFSDPAINRQLSRWCRENDFDAATKTLELRGHCQRCSQH